MARVTPGQPLEIKAATWNRLLDAADAVAQARLQTTADSDKLRRQSGSVIRVANGTDAAVPMGGVLAIENPIPDLDPDSEATIIAFVRDRTMRGIKPQEEHQGKFVITTTACPQPLDVIEAIAAGIAAVRVDVTSTDHEFADIAVDDVTQLKSTESGAAEILWRETPGTTGVQWCLVRIGGSKSKPHQVELFRPNQPIEKFSSGSATRLTLGGDDALTPTDDTQNVFNASGHKVTPSSLLVAHWQPSSERWIGLAAECCTDDCCSKWIAICICGDRKWLPVDGGEAEWILGDCCDRPGTLSLTLSCAADGETVEVLGEWEFVSDEDTESGIIDLSELCDGTVEELTNLISIEGCTLCDKYGIEAPECDPCIDPCQGDCCLMFDEWVIEPLACDPSKMEVVVDWPTTTRCYPDHEWLEFSVLVKAFAVIGGDDAEIVVRVTREGGHSVGVTGYPDDNQWGLRDGGREIFWSVDILPNNERLMRFRTPIECSTAPKTIDVRLGLVEYDADCPYAGDWFAHARYTLSLCDE